MRMTQRYSQDLRKYYRMPAVQVSMTLVLSIFVMAVFVLFALRPTLVSIATLRATIAESEKTLEKTQSKIVSLERANTVLEALGPAMAIFDQNIPKDGAGYSTMSDQLESLAIQNGVVLEGGSLGPTMLYSQILSPFEPNKKQSVIPLPFSVRVSGSYPQVVAFLTQLLSMERIVSIESSTITKETATKEGTPSTALNVSGQAYYLADEALIQRALGGTADKNTKKVVEEE